MKATSVFQNHAVLPDPSPLWLDAFGWLVPASFPSPAADHTEERTDLNKQLIRSKAATYVFRVEDDSMTGIGIYEGNDFAVWGVVTNNIHKLC